MNRKERRAEEKAKRKERRRRAKAERRTWQDELDQLAVKTGSGFRTGLSFGGMTDVVWMECRGAHVGTNMREPVSDADSPREVAEKTRNAEPIGIVKLYGDEGRAPFEIVLPLPGVRGLRKLLKDLEGELSAQASLMSRAKAGELDLMPKPSYVDPRLASVPTGKPN